MKESISIDNSTILRTIFWICFTYGLFLLQDILVSLFVSIVVASSINPAAKFFKKYRIPRSVTVTSIFVLGVAFVIATVLLFVPLIADDLARLIVNLPNIIERVNLFNKDLGLRDLTNYLNDISKDISKGQILTVLKNFALGASSVAHTTGLIISKMINLGIIFVLSFYMAMQENGVESFLRMITPKKNEMYVVDLWTRSQSKIARWAQGQLLLGAIIAVIVYFALSVMGIPYALLLAMLAFLGEMIPVVGIPIAMTPAVLIALSSGGVESATMVGVVYIIIAQIETHILQPRIMDRVVGVPALVVIIAILIGGELLGFWGILLAVPLAAIAMEMLSDLDKDKQKGVDINY